MRGSTKGRVRPPLRLTRRGRAVMFVLCLLVAAAGAMLAAPATRAALAPGSPEVAVVQPGDTLWSVAARHAPSRDPYGIIEEIRHLNRLPGHTIHPGQELVLP